LKQALQGEPQLGEGRGCSSGTTHEQGIRAPDPRFYRLGRPGADMAAREKIIMNSKTLVRGEFGGSFASRKITENGTTLHGDLQSLGGKG